MAQAAMQHRLMLDFRAASRGVTPREVTARLVRAVEAKRLPDDAYRSRTRLILKPVQETGERQCP
jgi:hypothetical protein